MKNIAQFRIIQEDGYYTAKGMDLPIVTQAKNWDELMTNIKEAVDLTLEGEDLADFGFARQPSLLMSFELPTVCHA
ncbi:MAG: type II toxin-antitoxin system HicB family antitoxin [Candidatus Paceibacterota bacterium]|jgi:predicted RNase H-like HicB family nuclease